jgi:hypothetical protein
MTDYQDIEDRGFSPAFDKIVGGGDDIVGLLAYSLHKKRKRAFAIEAGLRSNQAEIKRYHQGLRTEEIRDLRRNAETSLDAWSDQVARQVAEQIRSEELGRLTGEIEALGTTLDRQLAAQVRSAEFGRLKGEIEALAQARSAGEARLLRAQQMAVDGLQDGRSFRRNVWASVVGTFVFGILLSLVAQLPGPTNPLAPLAAAWTEALHNHLAADSMPPAVEPASGPLDLLGGSRAVCIRLRNAGQPCPEGRPGP